MFAFKRTTRLIVLGVSLTMSVSGQTPGAGKNLPDIFPDASKPAPFLQEGVAVPNQEATPTFTPDGQTVFMADNYKVCVSKKTGGKWSQPVPVSFSTARWKDW